METSNERVIYDINRDASYHDSGDVLVFIYDVSSSEASEIEVTEGYGEEESGRSPSEKSTYTLSPEMEKVLEYWEQFK